MPDPAEEHVRTDTSGYPSESLPGGGERAASGRAETGRSARKRRAIMEAATALFLRDGYRNTSMDQIAADAAVSKQTVYKQFARLRASPQQRRQRVIPRPQAMAWRCAAQSGRYGLARAVFSSAGYPLTVDKPLVRVTHAPTLPA